MQNLTIAPTNATLYESSELTIVTYCMVTMQILLMFVICGGNLLVIVVFGGNQRLRKPNNFYIVQLAISDLTVGMAMPYHAATFLYPIMLRNIHICLLRYAFSMASMCASLLSLVSLTVDRFSAMNWPLSYQQTLSTRRQILISLAIWITSIGGIFTPIMLVHYGWTRTLVGDCDLVLVMIQEFLYLVAPLFFGMCTSIILVLYIRILSIAYHHTKAIQSMEVSRDTSNHKNNFRAAKTTAVVLGVFYGCWAPFVILTTLQIRLDKTEQSSWSHIRGMLSMLAMLNSGMNPFIYAYKMPGIRDKFKVILKFRSGSEESRSTVISVVSS